MKNPVDGFSAGLSDENNLFEWTVTVIGPPDTLYEGGFFTALLNFPKDYPQNPPVCKFKSDMCGGAKLNQHAVEALHFLQRVYGITVVSAKVGRSLTADHGAFASLGLTVVDGVPNQIVLQDTETVLLDLTLALHDVREMKCVCVKEVCK